MPAPVIVMKDVGGFVTDYENQTALYRASQREVRLHECRSACTLALSLPNVCVYPDSKLKFHLAYDPRNHEPNAEVSQQMFNSYPAAVRARLGTLTRAYKVLSGSELIALGIRNCNAPKIIEPVPGEPKILIASAAPRKPAAGAPPQTGEVPPLIAGLMDKMLSAFGAGGAAPAVAGRFAGVPPREAAKQPSGEVLVVDIPLPPRRPAELTETAEATGVAARQDSGQAANQNFHGAIAGIPAAGAGEAPSAAALVAETADAVAVPPHRPSRAALVAKRLLDRIALPKLITGAQPILPPDFSAYMDIDR